MADDSGVHVAVIGQRGCRIAVFFCCSGERVSDSFARDGQVRGRVEKESGMVIEPVDDFNIGAARQYPVREIALPHLVGLRGREANV